MGLSRSRPSHEILSGDSADVYFARAETHPRQGRPRSARDDGGLHPRGRRPVRHRRGAQPARPRPGRCRPGRDAARGAGRRRRHRAQGDRPADPRPLPPVRAVRDGLPRDARPVDRLGDGRPSVRRGRRRRTRSSASGRGTSTRTSPTSSTTPRSSVAASARRRRPERGWPAWPRPARCPIRWCSSSATRSRRPWRSTGTCRRTCRGSSSSTRSRTRPRRRSGWPMRSATGCTASGSTRRPSVAGSPPTSSTRSARGSTRPASSHVKITVSGGLNPGADPRTSRTPARRSTRTPSGSYISGATPIDFTGDIKEIDGQPIAKRGRIPGLTDSPRLKPVDLAPYREG